MPSKRNRDRMKDKVGPKRKGAASRPPDVDEAKQPLIPKDWAWLDAISGPLDADMIEAALEQSTAHLKKNR